MHLIDNPATRVAWKIRDIQHRHMLMIQNILERYGLHFGQPRILYTVMTMNGAVQKNIAEKLQISPASLAMSIKRMQKAGLLEKVIDEKDLRTNQIRITAKGLQVHKDSLAEVTTSDHQMLAGFSPEEIAQLNDYLERIYQNLSQIEVPVHVK
jgi:DNA-binding MarR family transcriptional regulator